LAIIQPDESKGLNTALDTAARNRLKWRCRRGLLENDLLLERFFRHHEAALTRPQAEAIEALMELPDNDLLDLLLSRTQLQGPLDRAEVHDVLGLMRPAPGLPRPAGA
jgi:antitoxin CptB